MMNNKKPIPLKTPYNLYLSTIMLERFHLKLLNSDDAKEYDELAYKIKNVVRYMYDLQKEKGGK